MYSGGGGGGRSVCLSAHVSISSYYYYDYVWKHNSGCVFGFLCVCVCGERGPADQAPGPAVIFSHKLRQNTEQTWIQRRGPHTPALLPNIYGFYERMRVFGMGVGVAGGEWGGGRSGDRAVLFVCACQARSTLEIVCDALARVVL